MLGRKAAFDIDFDIGIDIDQPAWAARLVQARAAVDIDVKNSNSQVAYFAFGTVEPTGTLVVPDVGTGVTVFAGGTVEAGGSISGDTIAAPGGTIALSQATIIEVDPGSTITGIDVTDFAGGKFLVSLGQTLTYLDGTEFNAGSGVDSTVRWDKLEASIFPTGGGVNSIDLSAADFTSIDFTVQDLSNSSDSILQTSSVPMVDAIASIVSEAMVSSNGTYSADNLVTGTNGLYVPQLGANVLRIVSPSTTPSDSGYINLDNYIASAESPMGMGTITVSGDFTPEAGGTTRSTVQQDYSFTTYFDSSGDLIMVSNSVASDGIAAGHTIEVPQSALDAGVITDNPAYTVDGVASDISVNDVYAAALTNILGGFDFGFVDSTETIPGLSETFTQAADNPAQGTAEWYGPDVTPAAAFAAAQPDQPTFYSQYAAAMASLGNAYGFPFSDLLASHGPQLAPQSTDTILITVDSDTSAPCFLSGSRIETVAGPVAVEHLAVGDRVITADGGAEAIVWIGSRSLDLRRHPKPETAAPVRIRAHALGPGRPARDLWLSPDHALLVEGVLVPVKHLLTPGLIEQQPAGRITYWHLELAEHDILLAEGLAVESYLDTGDRAHFATADAVAFTLHPAWGGAAPDVSFMFDARGYAPLRVSGPEVARARAGLAERAAARRGVYGFATAISR